MNIFFTFTACTLWAFVTASKTARSLIGCELIPTDFQTGDRVYFFCDKEANWFMAQRHCASHGMNLATVDSDEVFNKLAPFTKSFHDEKGLQFTGFWIGGADLGNEGNWYWVSNGRFFSWDKWFPGEPSCTHDGQAEHCLSLWKIDQAPWIGFNDYVCDLKQRFICEAK